MFRHKAILIIHGLAGGTYDEEYLANYLELKRDYDVFSFTLPGHDVKDRRKATCEEWMSASEKQINYLIKHNYKKIYLVGHSMGGVIATHLAKEHKEVKKLVLVAAAFTSFASKEEGGVFNALVKIPDLIKTYSYNELMTRLNKLPIISAEKEFFELIEKYKDDINDINIPTMFVHGKSNQMVPASSSEKLYENMTNNKKKLLLIDNYYHDVFKGEKVEDICFEIKKFLKTYNFRIKDEKIEL